MRLEKLFRDTYGLTDDEIRRLVENIEFVSYPAKEKIAEEGRRCPYIYFLESGITRSYIEREAKEITLWISVENTLIPPFSSLTRTETSKVSVETVEKCIIGRISKNCLKHLFTSDIALANLGRELIENILSETDRYFTDYYWMTKQQQYRFFLSRTPDLLQRLSLQQIASFLNVTPQSLSRIRANLD